MKLIKIGKKQYNVQYTLRAFDEISNLFGDVAEDGGEIVEPKGLDQSLMIAAVGLKYGALQKGETPEELEDYANLLDASPEQFYIVLNEYTAFSRVISKTLKAVNEKNGQSLAVTS